MRVSDTHLVYDGHGRVELIAREQIRKIVQTDNVTVAVTPNDGADYMFRASSASTASEFVDSLSRAFFDVKTAAQRSSP